MYHYYMFHKPFGCVTARRDDRYPTVMDYFSELHNDNLNPVGRLDRETTGLLLITDDGMWNQKLTHPAYHKEKTYEFTVLGDLTEERIRALENGVLLKGAASLTSPARITVTGHHILSDILPSLHPEVQASISSNLPDHPVTFGTITITEGKKRQIRRMMKSVHCCVIELKRISIGNICLDSQLKPGEWKEFFPD
ncbi:MAG: pseudouridine synthase [Dorea sp.]